MKVRRTTVIAPKSPPVSLPSLLPLLPSPEPPPMDGKLLVRCALADANLTSTGILTAASARSLFACGHASLPCALVEHCFEWLALADLAAVYVTCSRAAKRIARHIASRAIVQEHDSPDSPDALIAATATTTVTATATAAGADALPRATAFGFRLLCRHARRLRYICATSDAVIGRPPPPPPPPPPTGSRTEDAITAASASASTNVDDDNEEEADIEATRQSFAALIRRNAATLREVAYSCRLAPSSSLLLAMSECPNLARLNEYGPRRLPHRRPRSVPFSTSYSLAKFEARQAALMRMGRELHALSEFRVSAYPGCAASVAPATLTALFGGEFYGAGDGGEGADAGVKLATVVPTLVDWPLQKLDIDAMPIECVASLPRFAATLVHLELNVMLYTAVAVVGEHCRRRFRRFCARMADVLPRLPVLATLHVAAEQPRSLRWCSLAAHAGAARDQNNNNTVVWRSSSLREMRFAAADHYQPWPRVEAPTLTAYDGIDLNTATLTLLLRQSPLLTDLNVSITRAVADAPYDLAALADAIDAIGVRPMRVVELYAGECGARLAAAIARNWHGVEQLVYMVKTGDGDVAARLFLGAYRATLRRLELHDDTWFEVPGHPLAPLPASPQLSTEAEIEHRVAEQENRRRHTHDEWQATDSATDSLAISASDATTSSPPRPTPRPTPIGSGGPPQKAIVMERLTSLSLRYQSAQRKRFCGGIGGGGGGDENDAGTVTDAKDGASGGTDTDRSGDFSSAASLAHVHWPALETVYLDLALGPATMADVLSRLERVADLEIVALPAFSVGADLGWMRSFPAQSFPARDGADNGGGGGGGVDDADGSGSGSDRKISIERAASPDRGDEDFRVSAATAAAAAAAAVTQLIVPVQFPSRHLASLLSWMPRVECLRFAFPIREIAVAGDDDIETSRFRGRHLLRLAHLTKLVATHLPHLTQLILFGDGYDLDHRCETIEAFASLAAALAPLRAEVFGPIGVHPRVRSALGIAQ
jgi:hypothetical protein